MTKDRTREWRVDDAKLWIEPGGGVTLKAVTAEGDPIELTANQARELAAALLETAAVDDAT
jgi:transposase-like protein